MLQTLTTLSKLILAEIRSNTDATSSVNYDATLADQQPPPPQDPEKGFRILSAGPAEGRDGEVQVPIRLRDEASGRHLDLQLRLSIGES